MLKVKNIYKHEYISDHDQQVRNNNNFSIQRNNCNMYCIVIDNTNRNVEHSLRLKQIFKNFEHANYPFKFTVE